MKLSTLKELNLPDNPGVYRFLDSKNEILYIGRATSLKDRVRSYFSKDLIETRGMHLVDMVAKSTTIEFTETPTVFDAILLEADLIKRLKPYYNTKEKDDKSGACILITKEDFPKVFAERYRTYLMKQDDVVYKKAEVFGPYPSMKITIDILKLLRKTFPFFDNKIKDKHQKRFYEQLGLSPTAGDTEFKKSYQKTISSIRQVLLGKRTVVIDELTKKMQLFSQQEKFEEAARVRDSIRALSRISDAKFIVETSRTVAYERIEAYDTSHQSGQHHVGVMVVLENGEPAKAQYRSFNIKKAKEADDIAATREVLSRRFEHTEWPFPNLVVIDGGEVHLSHTAPLIKQVAPNTKVVSVVKDEHHKAREILVYQNEIVLTKQEKSQILLANSEAHRFSKRLMNEKQKIKKSVVKGK